MLEIITHDTITTSDVIFGKHLIVVGIAVLVAIAIPLLMRKYTKDGIPFVLSGIVLVFFGVFPFSVSAINLENVINRENLESIESAYGIEFRAKTHDRGLNVIPDDGDYQTYKDVKRADSSGIYDKILIERDGNMITLSVPEVEGSTDYVPLTPATQNTSNEEEEQNG